MLTTCRLCAKSCSSIHATSIFSFHRNRLILDLISIFCPIRIERADNLPQNVCDSCLDLIQNAYELREKSVRVDIRLRSADIEEEEEEAPIIQTGNQQTEIVLVKQENPLDVTSVIEEIIPDASDFNTMDQDQNESEDNFGSEFNSSEIPEELRDLYYDKDGKRLRNNRPASSKYEIVNGRYKCPMCHKTFTFSNGVPLHIRQVHSKQKGKDKPLNDDKKKKIIKCRHCDEKFQSFEKRKRHVRKNHPELLRGPKTDDTETTSQEGISEPAPSTSSQVKKYSGKIKRQCSRAAS